MSGPPAAGTTAPSPPLTAAPPAPAPTTGRPSSQPSARAPSSASWTPSCPRSRLVLAQAGRLRCPPGAGRAWRPRRLPLEGGHPALDRPGRRRRQPAAGPARALRVRRGPALAARPLGDDQSAWFGRFVAGEIAGNAWSETGATTIDTQQTVLCSFSDGEGYRLKRHEVLHDRHRLRGVGRRLRFFRSGKRRSDDFPAIAIVDTREPGVTVSDDWDGFGQRGTGSGTATFIDVAVDPAQDVLPFGRRFPLPDSALPAEPARDPRQASEGRR